MFYAHASKHTYLWLSIADGQKRHKAAEIYGPDIASLKEKTIKKTPEWGPLLNKYLFIF